MLCSFKTQDSYKCIAFDPYELYLLLEIQEIIYHDATDTSKIYTSI